jgi:hypothetical protein
MRYERSSRIARHFLSPNFGRFGRKESFSTPTRGYTHNRVLSEIAWFQHLLDFNIYWISTSIGFQHLLDFNIYWISTSIGGGVAPSFKTGDNLDSVQ